MIMVYYRHSYSFQRRAKMTRFRLAMLSVAAFLSMMLVSPFPGQAAPAPPPGVPCGVQFQTINTFTKTGPSASVVFDMDAGLIVETKVNDDSVNWKKTFTVPVPLSGVGMFYRTKKFGVEGGNAAALPAYRIFLVNTDGPNSSTTLVYEPYYQGGHEGLDQVGNPRLDTYVTWNVALGKFWATKTVNGITAEAGGSYAGNKTLAQILVANPAARIAAIGIGQGTYNAGTRAWVNSVRFGCANYSWKPPVSTPSATSSATSSATATPTDTPSSGGTPSSSAGAVFYENCDAVRDAGKAPLSEGQPGYRLPLDSDGDGLACELNEVSSSLPLTGSPVTALLWTGGGVLLLGVMLVGVAFVRRRRVRFTA